MYVNIMEVNQFNDWVSEQMKIKKLNLLFIWDI